MSRMTTPYYQDDYVTLYHGDSLEILPTLDVKADVLLTDPPYFKVKQDEWDNQWDKASEFLGWMGDFLDRAKPLLTPQASVWVFASPAMASSVERLIGERFKVLNSIRWVKPNDRSSYTTLPSLRRFLTQWEGIVFAEQFEDLYLEHSDVLRRKVFATFGDYIRGERVRAGLTRAEIGRNLAGYKNLDSITANISNWELGKNLISEADYLAFRATCGKGFFDRSYASLKEECESLRADFEDQRESLRHLRRPFTITERGAETDVWNFPNVKHYKGRHPCEKPQSMLRHMIEVSSRTGGVILDPFAGSGSTLLAAAHAGMRSVGVEKDERWCEHAANKLSATTLDIFGAAA